MFQPTHTADRRHHHRDPRGGPGRDLPLGLRGMFGGRPRGGRPDIRRGEIRQLILAVLLRKPMHGYEVISELEAMSGGRWRPSAGSIYPTLQQLADEGLATSEEVDGRRTYTLTEAGRAAAAASPSPRRWTDAAPDGEPDLRQLFRQLMEAVMQVERVGTPQARAESTRILVDARRRVYRLLAEDAGADEPAADDGDAPGA